MTTHCVEIVRDSMRAIGTNMYNALWRNVHVLPQHTNI